jgi:hypothetical protein
MDVRLPSPNEPSDRGERKIKQEYHVEPEERHQRSGVCSVPRFERQFRLALRTCREHGSAVLVWGPIAERRVRRDGVVIGEPRGELVEHGICG